MKMKKRSTTQRCDACSVRTRCQNPRLFWLCCLALVLCTICHVASVNASTTLEQSLNNLGIDTAPTARSDDEGEALPADYSPFGSTWAMSKTSELLLIGVETPATGTPVSLFELTGENGEATEEARFTMDETQAPWAKESLEARALPQRLRDAVGADVDGDGLEEMVVAYQDAGETRLYVIEDAPSGFAPTDVQIAFEQDVTNVTLQTGDVDGNGTHELVLGLTRAGAGLILFVERTPSGYEALPTRLVFEPVLTDSILYLQLATGNLDHDRAEELVVVVNEYAASNFGPDVATSRFAIYDDRDSGFALLTEGDVHGRDLSGALHTAIVATPAIGDVDGDNLGEVFLGGLTAYTRFCDAAPYFLLGLDDSDHGFSALGGHAFTHFFSGCSSPADPQVRTVYLNALDIDGDGRDELQVNLFVFEDWVDAAPWTEVVDYRLPDAVMWEQNDFGHIDLTTSDMVTGDFTGDNREDIVVYRQDQREIAVWGVSQIDGFISKMRSIQVPFLNSQRPVNPVLAAVNVDTDSPVLKYAEGEYRLVFSEPVVIAALAAAPCMSGMSQNTGACRTAFGNTESVESVSERSVTVSVGASVGASFDGGIITQSGFELKTTATVAATRVTSESYALSKTILFTSGANEDTVVFTTVPLDQYTYTILSHPDPELVGETLTINLPRDPITLQAERSFYNDAVMAGSLKIDERIFRHTIGDPLSYPTPGEKNLILGSGRALSVGPVSVGQGTGETQVTLEVAEAFSEGGTLELGYEISLEVTTGGAIGGVTVGGSASDTFSVTSGVSTTYTGSVGAIEDPASFSANQYAFGLFTYVYRDPVTQREFEVLNYWVE